MKNAVQQIEDLVDRNGLPSNLDAERSVLGAILLNNEVCYQASDLLKREEFFLDSHRRLFDKMVSLTEREIPIDLISLSDELRRTKDFEQIGGASYIASLISGVPRTDDISHYAKIIRSKAKLRNLINAARQIAVDCYTGELEDTAVVEKAERLVFDIGQDQTSSSSEEISMVASRLADFYEEKCQDHSKLIGISTGYIDIDRRLSGLVPALITIAGRPGHAKTSVGMNLSCNVALAGGSVFFSSIESSADDIGQRVLASLSRIDSLRMREGRMSREEWKSLSETLCLLAPIKFTIDDTPDMTPDKLLSRLRQHKIIHGLDLVVIDHLQLMAERLLSDESYKFRDIRSAIRYIMVQLVKIRKMLKVPIILLAQLGRDVDTRSDHRPMMSDLLESSAIEQNSDIVLFLLREELYNQTDKNKGIIKIIFGKFREGSATDGDIDMAFIERYTRMESLCRD